MSDEGGESVPGAFKPGDPCLLIDTKNRRYHLVLRPEAHFQYHLGVLPHGDIIGHGDGTVFYSSKGSRLLALRPRLADYVLKMKRGAQLVYPKDTGAIIVYADIGPGMTVVEAGTGSGSLTMALLRAVGPDGKVVSVDRRGDHQRHAAAAIETFFGGLPESLDLREGDVEDVIADVRPDRIVLDVPEPWHSIPLAIDHMANGGVFCCYLPTVPQVQETRERLGRSRRFAEVGTFEILLREWAVEGRSVRPSHQMVGHTGFITVARKVDLISPANRSKLEPSNDESE